MEWNVWSKKKWRKCSVHDAYWNNKVCNVKKWVNAQSGDDPTPLQFRRAMPLVKKLVSILME